jgi:hypothetical protein
MKSGQSAGPGEYVCVLTCHSIIVFKPLSSCWTTFVMLQDYEPVENVLRARY